MCVCVCLYNLYFPDCLFVGVLITYDRQSDTIARIVLLLMLIALIMVISSRLKGTKGPFGMDMFVSLNPSNEQNTDAEQMHYFDISIFRYFCRIFILISIRRIN